MPTDQAMLNEAIDAARAGNKIRAKDLLTRLLRIDKDYPEHWLWMSAVVETRQEQIYCLQNLLRVDPDNTVARRGLIMLGALDVEASEVKPVQPQRREAWSVADLEIERPRGWQAIMANPVLRFTVYASAAILVLSLLTAGVMGIGRLIPAPPTPNFAQTAAAVGAVITLTPSPTLSPTVTPEFPTQTPTPAAPTPLALLLDATYTPTPLYVDTPHPETEAFRLGLRARDRGDWEAVIELMEQTLDVSPDAADPYYYIGDANLQLGRYAAALTAFNQAITADNRFGAAYLGRAQALLGLNPNADVDDEFLDALFYAPDFGLIYLERAQLRIERGDFSNAETDLAQAAARMPDSALVVYLQALLALRQGDLDTAFELAELAHEIDFTHLPTYRLLGEAALADGRPAEAAEWLHMYTRYAPNDLAGLNLLAAALAATGEVEEALGIFNHLIESGLADADTYLGRGMAQLDLGDPEAALDDLNQANRLNRNDFEIMLGLGRALLAIEDPGDAYVQFNVTLPLAVTPQQQALVYFYRGVSLKQIVENGDLTSIPAAERDLEDALALSEYLSAELAAEAELLLDELEALSPEP